MSYILESKKRKAKQKASIGFDRGFKLRRQKDDPLKNRADAKTRSEKATVDKIARMKVRGVDSKAKPASTVDRMRVSRSNASRGRDVRLRTTTPKAREKETELYKSKGASSVREGLMFAGELMAIREETSKMQCIVDVTGRAERTHGSKVASLKKYVVAAGKR
jgi:hypothetical protein